MEFFVFYFFKDGSTASKLATLHCPATCAII